LFRSTGRDLRRAGVADGTRHPMQPRPDGWWAWRGAEHTAYGVELDYGFSLNGGDPLPDPRSAWQPYGVDGPSRWFDPGGYEWGDTAWPGPRGGGGTLGAVFYELHVGTFTAEGTFAAATERLGHLVDLGVDVVQVMPVAAFSGRWGWGYDGVDLYAVHDAYGGPAAFQAFVDACHGRGLGVCLDVVYNHLGPSGNYLAEFGPYFTERYLTPWGPAVNLDGTGSGEVRRFVVDNALRWLHDFHVDALRLDAVHALHDDSPRHILAELSHAVSGLSAELGRPLALVAESGALAKVLTSAFFHDGCWSSFRGQVWGRPVDRRSVDGRCFVVALQSHDQVGNRAMGDRITASVTPGQQAIGAALSLLSAYSPMVFMGEEWAASTPFQFFTDFQEPALQAAVVAGRRAEFASHDWGAAVVPNPQDPATRERSVLRWEELQEPGHGPMLEWYRELVRLRRETPELASGDLGAVAVSGSVGQGWLVMARGAFRVVVTLADRTQLVALDGPPEEIVLVWGEATRLCQPDGIRLTGHSVAVVRIAQGPVGSV
jgi:maltooligosyltrehalose trehalohydrolase